ncbi:hypothetical protein PGIGA_G00060320 [Pangasianodon gigas]|uniref:Uncharacterized protein n=1 Tax=Pangasianodon gigas TaxID=30993 RepID=A0ACC5X5C3_PANGG|nr:hypothetical protein [Pangasianodon gigas]
MLKNRITSSYHQSLTQTAHRQTASFFPPVTYFRTESARAPDFLYNSEVNLRSGLQRPQCSSTERIKALPVLFLVSLQGTTTGDDTIREILSHLEDLTHYSSLFTFDTSQIFLTNMQMGSIYFCICKDLIAQELLKTLVLAKITDGDVALELHAIFRMLQYNIKALLQQSGTETVGLKCPRHRTEVLTEAEQKAPHLIFVKQCIRFFQRWMNRCRISSDY